MKKLLLLLMLLPFLGFSQPCAVTGDQATYGINSWIGYVYNNSAAPASPGFLSSNYRGFVTETEIFDRNYGNSVISGANLCGTYQDNFSIRYRMRKNFAPGNYTFTVGGDDGYRLSLDGGATFLATVNNFTDHGYVTSTSNALFLSGNVDLVLEYYERGGDSRVSFNYTQCNTGALVDPSQFGNNVWNVYGYNATTLTPPVSTYRGFYVQNTLNADTQDIANNGWNSSLSPSSSAGWSGCALPNDNFTFIQKRRGFPCGKYNLFLNNWDDATRVLLNGTIIFNNGSWFGNGPGQALGEFILNNDSTIEIITIENSGAANARLTITPLNIVAIYTGSWSTAPDDLPVEIRSDLDINGNLSVCSCTVSNSATVKVKTNAILVVQDFVNIGATSKLIVENNGSLVQSNNFAVNTGTITFKRNSTPMKKFDYTYWSSPVTGATLSNLSTPSPTVSYAFDPVTNKYIAKPASTIMEIGKGYIARTPDALDYSTPQTVEAVFNGKPNNGIFTVPLVTGAGTSNLLGNPYPSAVSLDAFLLNANNAGLTTGTIYLWTHTIPRAKSSPTSNTLVYTANDYAKYNLTGGTKSISSASGGTVPNGNLASGQGFFVESVGPVGTKNLIFNNSMRVRTANKNDQFFRSSTTSKSNVDNTVIEKNRLWLSISNEQGAFDEILVGYITGATNGLDYGYDGNTFSGGNVVSLYSILEDVELSIQGKSLDFDENESIPLGFSSTIGGTFSIGIENLDGFFTEKNVFLLDKSNDVITDLKLSKYTFNAVKGTFNNRFELRYTSNKLSTGNPIMAQNDVAIFKKSNGISVVSKTENLDVIAVYDLLGRLIYQNTKINNTTFSTGELGIKNQVVIVKVAMSNGVEVTKKVIIN